MTEPRDKASTIRTNRRFNDEPDYRLMNRYICSVCGCFFVVIKQ